VSEGNLLTTVLADEERPDYILADTANPNSVINITRNSTVLQKAIARTLAEAPDLLAMDEGTIRIKVRPTATASRLRLSFWEEYEKAVNSGRQMRLSGIFKGVCSENHFIENFLQRNDRVAYMLTPPANYVVQVKEALYEGLETLRQIVSAPVIDDQGYLIPRAADVVLKAVQMLDARVKGAVVQRIDQRMVSLNMNQNMQDQNLLPASMEDIEKQLEEVKMKLVSAPIKESEYQLPAIDKMKVESGVEVLPSNCSSSGSYTIKGRNGV